MNYTLKNLLILLISFSLIVGVATAKKKENSIFESKKISKTSKSNDNKKSIEKAKTSSKTNSKTDVVTSESITTEQQSTIVDSKDESATFNLTNPLTGEEINWQVIASGGNSGSSTNYILGSTVGQSATGYGTSTNYGLSSGFWQEITAGGCCIGIRGNVDGSYDDIMDIDDLVYMVGYMFGNPNGPEPPCMDEANIDGQVGIDIDDLVYMVAYMFGNPNGPQPADCP